jgi:hypothetical protein
MNIVPLSPDYIENLYKQFRLYYKLKDIETFIPIFNEFKEIHSPHRFNNIYILKKLLNKLFRVEVTGYVFRALICNKKTNCNIYKKIFIKELPIFNPFYYYKFQHINLNHHSIPNPYNHKLLAEYFSNNNSAYIECFVSSILSKLVENNISPHFPNYYGHFTTILDKATYNINSSYDKIKNDGKFKKKIYKYKGEHHIQYKNFPTILICQDYIDLSFDEYITKQMMGNLAKINEIILSIIFQVSAGLYIIHNSITHNDLHLGNIMFKKTKKRFLYYHYNKKIYRIPTFGYILKIIDWGRATIKYKHLNLTNNVFSYNGDAYQQYYFPNLNSNRKTDIIPSKSMDLSILLYQLKNEQISAFTSSNIREILNYYTTLSNKNLDTKYKENNIFTFQMYQDFNKYADKATAENILSNTIFEQFVQKKQPRKTIYYKLRAGTGLTGSLVFKG